MCGECFHPVLSTHAGPNFVRYLDQGRLVMKWPACCDRPCPRLRAATGKNLPDRFFVPKLIPASQHIAHAKVRFSVNDCRNSATRFPATAARYAAVERMSSIGWISVIVAFRAVATIPASITFPLT